MNRTGENRSTVLLRGRIHQANLNMDFILSYQRFVQLFYPLLLLSLLLPPLFFVCTSHLLSDVRVIPFFNFLCIFLCIYWFTETILRLNYDKKAI